MGIANVQVSSVWEAGDVAAFNYSGSDIPAFRLVKIDATNTASNAVTGAPIPAMVGVALPATGGNPDPCWGVTMEIIKAGNSGRVRTRGIAPVLTDGVTTAGTVVDASATVAGAVKAHTAAKYSIGTALITAADTEVSLVDITGANPNA